MKSGRARHDDEVVGFPGRNALLNVERPGEDRRDLVSRLLFEPGHQLAIGLLGGLGRENLDFSGTGSAVQQHDARGGDGEEG